MRYDFNFSFVWETELIVEWFLEMEVVDVDFFIFGFVGLLAN